MKLTSVIPHLFNAYYEWLLENDLTPYIRVALTDDDGIPKNHPAIKDGKIVLNLKPEAINQMYIGEDCLSFQARFAGVSQIVRIDLQNIEALFAKEINVGFVFGDGQPGPGADDEIPPPEPTTPTKRPALRLVK